jgi:diguanylate cyclase
MSKLLNNNICKIFFIIIITITLLFPAIKVIIETLCSKAASESIYLWVFYTFFLIMSCIIIVYSLALYKEPSKKPIIKPTQSPEKKNDDDLKKKLSETESVLKQVMLNLSSAINELSKTMDDQGASLAVHKENILMAKSVKDFEAISDILVKEISTMIDSNKGMKEKINSANEIIYEQNKNLSKLVTETMTDHLTEILNKRGFEKRLDEEYIRYKRYEGKLAVITLDLDKFKEINDTYGHLFGDKVLRSFSQLLVKYIRETDIIGRIGGEEFSILLPETDLAGAMKTAFKINELLSTSILNIDNNKIKLTVSSGVAMLKNGESKTDFLDRADQALYYSKKSGRNKITSEEDLKK